MLSTDQKAPAFSLPDQDGRLHGLADYAGEWVVMYFYAASRAPESIKEACAFRDAFDSFDALDTVILGVGEGSSETHAQVTEEHTLPFTLLSDPGQEVANAYGVVQGEEGIGRMTYIINPQGKIAKAYREVTLETHAAEVLKDLTSLKQSVH